MYMCNCGACLSCSQASFGNLFRRDGKVRRHVGQGLIAGYGAGDDDFIRSTHEILPVGLFVMNVTPAEPRVHYERIYSLDRMVKYQAPRLRFVAITRAEKRSV